MEPAGEQILEAGRAIRPYLAELFPERPGTRQELDVRLATALALTARDKEAAASQVHALLRAHPETAHWTVKFTERGVPEEAVRRGHGPSGPGELVAAPRYACPVDDDYVWYRRSASILPPRCPTHDVRVRPAPRTLR
ncbi:hypothetical protein ACWDR3_41290 [Streptomyces sp. NPDC001002]